MIKYYRPVPDHVGHLIYIYEADELGCNQYELDTDYTVRLVDVGIGWFEHSQRYIRINKRQFDSMLGRANKEPLTFKEKILAAF